jgi:hypothetical protein
MNSEQKPNDEPQAPVVASNALLGTCMYGVRPELPVRGFPPGRIRIRQRNTGFPSAFVKTTSGIRHFIIAELDGYWVPYAEQGANHTPNATAHVRAVASNVHQIVGNSGGDE